MRKNKGKGKREVAKMGKREQEVMKGAGENKGRGIRLVEMSCRRHRNRVEVLESWLETCDYLCPRCYHKLSKQERKVYAPKSKNKRKVQRAKIETKAVGKKLVAAEGSKTQTKGLSIEDFKPKYRIHCQKCGEIVPCHYEWYDKSTVLCPQCYCAMSEVAISLFHMEHKAEKPKREEGEMPKLIDSGIRRKTAEEYAQWDRNHIYKESGGRWPEEKIRRASERALQGAVKRGLVSAVRCRIELRRRKNKEYYDSMAATKYDLPVIVRIR